MTEAKAKKMAERLMRRFGLEGWVLKIWNVYRYAGFCVVSSDGGTREIRLSRPYIEANSREVVTDLIKHEIAHALDYVRNGEASGHKKPWKDICVEIGCIPFSGQSAKAKRALNAVCPERPAPTGSDEEHMGIEM